MAKKRAVEMDLSALKMGDRVYLRNGGLDVPAIVMRVHPNTTDPGKWLIDLVTFEGNDPLGSANPYQDVPYSATPKPPQLTWFTK